MEEKNLEEAQSPEGPQTPEAAQDEKKATSAWQAKKESWYDKVPLNLKQLDIIIGVCLTLLALCFVLIALDAMGIYNVFG